MDTAKPNLDAINKRFDDQRLRFIADNHNAPADTLIKALFLDGFRVYDEFGGKRKELESADDALLLWYNLDEMHLVVHNESTQDDGFVVLIHQESFARPSIDDIVDHSTDLCDDKYPNITRAMQEDNYPGYFH